MNIHFQICDETTVGMAHGIRIAIRKKVLPLNFAFATSATARPRTVSIVTEKKVNISVFQTERHQSGSEKTNA